MSGVKWHTLAEGVADPSTADGAFTATLRSAFAQMESHRKAERQRNASRARAFQGKHHIGNRRFGYDKSGENLVPAEVAAIQWAYEQILAGATIYSIIRRWNNEGLRTAAGKLWTYAGVQQVLKRKTNAGIVVYRGKELEGVEATWPTVIEREEFDTVYAILTDPARSYTRIRDPRWLGAGLVKCGACGSVMRTAGANNHGEVYAVYRCKTRVTAIPDGFRHATYRAAELDTMVGDAIVSTFLVGPSALLEDADGSASEVALQLAKRADVQRRLGNLAEAVEEEGLGQSVHGLRHSAPSARRSRPRFSALRSHRHVLAWSSRRAQCSMARAESE